MTAVERWTEVRLSSLLYEVKRPVTVDADAAYREIGIRSHGRGIFHKDAVSGTALGEKSVFWLQPGDLVFNIVFAWEGAVALTGPSEAGYIGSHRFPSFKTHQDADARFLLYFFQTEQGLFLLGENSPGGAGRNRTLDRGRLLKEKILAPDIGTQRAIARFLDVRVGAIDAALTRCDHLRRLLAEHQHSSIVGQPPYEEDPAAAPEWLDRLSSGWSTKRARYLFRQVQRSPQEGEGVVTAFRDGQVTLRENRRADGFTFAVQEVGYQRVHEGDLVVHSMDAFAGAIGVSESTGKCSPEYVVLEPLTPEVRNAYYAACMRWMAAEKYIFVICPSVRERAPRLRFSTLKDVVFPVPPDSEQKRIEWEVNRARGVAGQVDRLEGYLVEYRRALIEQAVSGQINLLHMTGTSEAA